MSLSGALEEWDPEAEALGQTSSPRSCVVSLLSCWQNECNAPDLLPYPADTIEAAKGEVLKVRSLLLETSAAYWAREGDGEELLEPTAPVEEEEEEVKEHERETLSAVAKLMSTDPVIASLYEMHASRVQYLLSDYHRVRLVKIEKYALFLLSNARVTEILSPLELTFARRYVDAWGKVMNDSYLQSLNVPDSIKSMSSEEMMTRPSLSTHVFMRILGPSGEALGSLNVQDEEPIEMTGGDVWLIRYDSLRARVLTNEIQLL